MIYYSKIYKAKSAKGKEAWAKFGASQKQACKSSVPVESLRMHLIAPSNEKWQCVYFLPRELINDLVPKILLSWSWKHSLLSMYQNFRLPERKQVFRIKYIVCTKSLGTVIIKAGFIVVQRTIYQSSSQMPAKAQLCKKIFLKRALLGPLC